MAFISFTLNLMGIESILGKRIWRSWKIKEKYKIMTEKLK